MVTVSKMYLVALLAAFGERGLIEVLADRGQGPQILVLGPSEIAGGRSQRDGVLKLVAADE